MSFWSSLARIFVPQVEVRPTQSIFAAEPDAANRERPLPLMSQTRWRDGDVEKAIHAADSGDLSHAARLCNALRRDGTLQGLLSSRTGGLVRLPRQFRGSESVLSEIDRKDQVSTFDRIFPQKELALLAEDGILLGVGVGELLPVPGEKYPRFVRLNPEFLRYRWSEDRWYYQSAGGPLPITPGDGRWVLHMPGGYVAPWQNALWSSLGRSYIQKEHAYLNRGKFAAQLANPARAAVSPIGATDGQRRGFLQRLIAWGAQSAFDLPPGWDIKIIESNGRGYEVFQDVIDTSNKEFAIAISGQVITMDGGTGFANAGIHATIRSDLIQGDGDALAGTLNAQALAPIVDWFFGSGHSCLVAWDTASSSDRNAEAASISGAANAIKAANEALAGSGLRIDVREVATRFHVPVVEDVAPPALPAAPPALPAAPPQPVAAPILQEAA